jgi:hypothetical protein
MKAMAQYIELKDQKDQFVIAFLNRLWITRNGPTMTAEFHANPDKLLKKKPSKKP